MSNHGTMVWLALLDNIGNYGAKVAPRNLPCFEVLNCQTTIDMNDPVVLAKGRKLGYRFMAAEAYWILTGDNRVETIAPYAGHIKRFSDDGVSYFGAYGPRVMDQIYRVAKVLATDPDSRQAVLTIWRPNPPETKDVPCTVAIQWFIRDSKLYCIDTMRSSDAWLGWPYDVFNFSCISWYLAAVLRECYMVHVDLGELCLNAGSQHLYERNMDEVKKVLEQSECYDIDLRLDRIFKGASHKEILKILELTRDAPDGLLYLAEENRGRPQISNTPER